MATYIWVDFIYYTFLHNIIINTLVKADENSKIRMNEEINCDDNDEKSKKSKVSSYIYYAQYIYVYSLASSIS